MTSHDARQRLLDAAYRSFYRKGFARSGLDDISAEAGVNKKTLYYHFASKDDLLAAVLERQSEPALQEIRRWATALEGELETWVATVFEEIANWGEKPWFTGTGFSRVVMELADLPGHPARAVARRHKRAVEDWFVDRLEQSGDPDARLHAREIVLLIEGAVLLMLIHGDLDYARSAGRAATCLLKASKEASRYTEHGTP